MQNKLQELTDKIYQEGLNRGNEEANSMIKAAKKEAKKIIEKAKSDEVRIIEQAEKKALELKANAEAESRLALKQAVNSLKQQIVSLINGDIISEDVTDAFKGKDFVKELIVKLVENWNASSDENQSLEILLPEKDQKEADKWFTSKIKASLQKGVKLTPVKNMENGFDIIPAKKGYKINFSDEVFKSFLKDYLRPKLYELLYAEDKN